MSFQATLVLDGTTDASGTTTINGYRILECDFEIFQGVGSRNLPNRATEIGLIHLVLESGNSNELLVWGMSTGTKNGSIAFTRRDATSPLKTLIFENAFCIKYRETFNANGELPMRVHLTISPYIIRLQGIGLQQRWTGFRASSSSSQQETNTSPQASDRDETNSQERNTRSNESSRRDQTNQDEERDHSNESNNSGGNSNDSDSQGNADEERDNSNESNNSGGNSNDSDSQGNADEERDNSNESNNSGGNSNDSDSQGNADEERDNDDIPSFRP